MMPQIPPKIDKVVIAWADDITFISDGKKINLRWNEDDTITFGYFPNKSSYSFFISTEDGYTHRELAQNAMISTGYAKRYLQKKIREWVGRDVLEVFDVLKTSVLSRVTHWVKEENVINAVEKFYRQQFYEPTYYLDYWCNLKWCLVELTKQYLSTKKEPTIKDVVRIAQKSLDTVNEDFWPTCGVFEIDSNIYDKYIKNGRSMGRLWVDWKLLCMWDEITPQSMSQLRADINKEVGIDISDYEMLYDNGSAGYGHVVVDEYIRNGAPISGKNRNSAPMLHMEKPKSKWEKTSDFRKSRDNIKAVPKEKTAGSVAQYNAMRHPYGESVNIRKLIITEEQYDRIFEKEEDFVTCDNIRFGDVVADEGELLGGHPSYCYCPSDINGTPKLYGGECHFEAAGHAEWEIIRTFYKGPYDEFFDSDEEDNNANEEIWLNSQCRSRIYKNYIVVGQDGHAPDKVFLDDLEAAMNNDGYEISDHTILYNTDKGVVAVPYVEYVNNIPLFAVSDKPEKMDVPKSILNRYNAWIVSHNTKHSKYPSNMTIAQYNALRYPYGESVERRMIITQEQYERLFSGKQKIFVTEEQADRLFLINEDIGGKSINKAVKFAENFCDTHETANDFVRTYEHGIRAKFPNVRPKKGQKYTLGVTRIHFTCNKYGLDRSQMESRIDKIIGYICSDENLYKKYDMNLNGLSDDELINEFKDMFEDEERGKRDTLSKTDFGQENGNYDIVRIDSAEQAHEYQQSVPWCVTHIGNWYDNYTKHGARQFYFMFRKGWEEEKKPSAYDAKWYSKYKDVYPADPYGLSALAVLVDIDGSLVSCTSRWNDTAMDGHVLDEEGLSKLIGKNFYDVFRPVLSEEEQLKEKFEELKNGHHIQSVFKDAIHVKDDKYIINFKTLYAIVTKDGKMVTDRWYNDIYYTGDHTMRVKADINGNEVYYLMNDDGKRMAGPFDSMEPVMANMAYIVYTVDTNAWEPSYNILTSEGKYVLDSPVGDVKPPSEGWFPVELDDCIYNFIDLAGNKLSERNFIAYKTPGVVNGKAWVRFTPSHGMDEIHV